MKIALARLLEVSEGAWPPAKRWQSDDLILREGQGGGQRVSAATAQALLSDERIDEAARAMADMGQVPLFQVQEGQEALDDQLDRLGYESRDRTHAYVIPIERLTDRPLPRVTAFTIWEPLAIMKEIWATDGIGPDRLTVMDRAARKTGVLGRWNEKPGGVAFVGLHEGIAMVHALVVLPHQRRQGLAQWLMRAAALWAQGEGASHMAVLCVADNGPANALYERLGFRRVGSYHYRRKPE